MSQRGKKPKKTRSGNRTSTTISQHRREGKKLLSPFGGLPNLQPVSWLRDFLPDYLWICSHLLADPDGGLQLVGRIINEVNEVLDGVLDSTPETRPTLDGTLTSWEAIPEQARAAVLDRLTAAGVYDVAFAEDFAQTLGMYPTAPGAWILGPWRERSNFRVDPVTAERVLSEIVSAAANGSGPVATRAKALAIRGLVVGRKFTHTGDEVMQMVPLWPDQLSENDRKKVESVLRSMFMAFEAAQPPEASAARTDWVQAFWRTNWRLFPCRVRSGDHKTLPSDLDDKVAALSARMDETWGRFMAIAVQADPDLYAPDRWEVLSGITARALRSVHSAIVSPARWTLEHLAPDLRALSEALIVFRWLEHKRDPALFTRFKDFGRGHLKLLKLHWDDYAESFGDEVPAEVQAQLDELTRLVNQDIDEDFQNVDLSGNFAGIDTRKMASEVAMENDYRLVFAPSSAGAHGEWSHLDRYALERCVNPTHRFHRVPRGGPSEEVVPELTRSLLDAADELVDAYEKAAARSPH